MEVRLNLPVHKVYTSVNSQSDNISILCYEINISVLKKVARLIHRKTENMPGDQDPIELNPIKDIHNLLIAFHCDGEVVFLLGFADFDSVC